MATLPVDSEFEPVRLRRITRFEYDRMVDEGWFAPEERAELLDGLVYVVSPPLPPHSSSTGRVMRALVPLLGRAELRVQQPIAVSDWSEPEPDLALVPLADYATAHPSRAYLVVEVSQSTLRYDKGIKRRVYAEAGIPEYWIVNLVDRVVEVYTDPREGTYATARTFGVGETVSPTAFPDLVVPVAALLP